MGGSHNGQFKPKRKLQRELKWNVTQISQPMTEGGVANSVHWIGVHN